MLVYQRVTHFVCDNFFCPRSFGLAPASPLLGQRVENKEWFAKNAELKQVPGMLGMLGMVQVCSAGCGFYGWSWWILSVNLIDSKYKAESIDEYRLVICSCWQLHACRPSQMVRTLDSWNDLCINLVSAWSFVLIAHFIQCDSQLCLQTLSSK